ncbi:RNA ligase family protein [Metaclostridioides mangenotii]|uniref:ATP-dependent DNA ligase n=1 Tax=Metaclostridioides mangenotii TaxID=1540 RepID=UPI0004641339|nr:RNA ligase family protein [Clostridioides mangenotii]
MDLFEEKGIKPMLIYEMQEAFDSDEYVYELKWDGIRCIAYLDPDNEYTDLRNKRDFKLLPRVPELENLHKQVKQKCILDGELIAFKNGAPDFYEIQRRAILTDPFKIRISANSVPATYVAYDIIYLNDEEVIWEPLMKRKELLSDVVIENERIAVSRFIEKNGTYLFELAKEQNLEGIVAKDKESKYWFGKRSRDWIKVKYLKDADFVICGYVLKENNMTSLVIGNYIDNKLEYKGHVTLGVSLRKLNQYKYKKINESPFGYVPYENEEAVWISPELICTVTYMPNENGSMRQPVLKSIQRSL